MTSFWKPGTNLPQQNHASSDIQIEKEDSNQGGDTITAHFNFSRAPISQQRLNLPISKHRRQILYAMEEFKVIVIVGETGRCVVFLISFTTTLYFCKLESHHSPTCLSQLFDESGKSTQIPQVRRKFLLEFVFIKNHHTRDYICW